jgi:hypothetical protein
MGGGGPYPKYRYRDNALGYDVEKMIEEQEDEEEVIDDR